MSESSSEVKVITVHNASACTAYELRQELNRRNAFDFGENDTVNYRTMLKRLMVELVKDEEDKANEKVKVISQERETEMEKSKRIREEKKREALERSRQRQSDPNYFKKIAELNKKPEKAEDNNETTADTQETEEDEEDNDHTPSNPFDTFPKKGRSKIYVR
mmetsp:Transcript_4763/g.7230  ORF Transcript_4763/g.7230 Transcript_4763/m.7230 type:complete len:162 (-) Transcript_4763:122-607(-)